MISSSDGHRAGKGEQSAVPENNRDGHHAEQLDRGEEHGKGRDRVLVGFHVDAIQFGELLPRFPLAVKDLHDAHAADVFLQERIDARDGRADAPVGVAHAVAEDPRGNHDQRQHREVASASRQFFHIITAPMPAE